MRVWNGGASCWAGHLTRQMTNARGFSLQAMSLCRRCELQAVCTTLCICWLLAENDTMTLPLHSFVPDFDERFQSLGGESMSQLVGVVLAGWGCHHGSGPSQPSGGGDVARQRG